MIEVTERLMDLPEGESCAKCGDDMPHGATVLDVPTTAGMPFATAEWATVHPHCWDDLFVCEWCAGDGCKACAWTGKSNDQSPVDDRPA